MQYKGTKASALVCATLLNKMTMLKRANAGQSFLAAFFIAGTGALAGLMRFCPAEAVIFGTAQSINAAINAPQTAKRAVPDVFQAVRAAAAIKGAMPNPKFPPTEKMPMPVALCSLMRLTVCAATG